MDPDRAIAVLASSQRGAFSRRQALESGFSPWMIRHRVSSGRWLQLHPGVYCLHGVGPSWHRDQTAACLWGSGPSAGIAAGHLFDLPGCEDPPIEILTTPAHRAMSRCGIVVHLTKRLPQEQIAKVEGIPCTTIERTLLDLCGQFDLRRSAIAIDNALFRGLTTIGSLDHCLFLTARQGRNGCGRLRTHLKKRMGLGEFPNSPLETVIFEMICAAGLPLPRLQHEIRDGFGYVIARPDFFYPEANLAIEGHSRLWHSGPAATDSDRAREARLLEEGIRVVYIGWADAVTHADRTIALIHRHLMHAERAVDPLS